MPSKRLPWWWLTIGLATWLSLMVAPSVRAEEILIDDFTFAPAPPPHSHSYYLYYMIRDDPNHTEFTHTCPDDSIIGQEREAVIHVDGPSPIESVMPAVGFIGVHHPTAPDGKLAFGLGGRPGTSATLIYDGEGSGEDANGLDGLDLTNGGTNNGIRLCFDHVNGVEPDGLDLRITAHKKGGGTPLTYDGYVPNSVSVWDHFVAFSEFGAGYFDLFSNLDKLVFEFNKDYNNYNNYTINVDFGLLSVKAVPEPSTLALFGLGVFILVVQQGCRRRRRCKN